MLEVIDEDDKGSITSKSIKPGGGPGPRGRGMSAGCQETGFQDVEVTMKDVAE